MPLAGISGGDRVVYLGIGQRRGRHADLVGGHRGFANLRFDDGQAMLANAADCHPIPRRPPPDF